MRREPRLVRFTVQLYGFLVWLYPRAFRRRYGDAMIQLFHDASRDAYGESGGREFLGFVLASSVDYVQSLFREHWEFIMVQRTRFKQYTFRAMAAGCVALAVISLSLWVASRNDSIGLFSLSQDTSLRFTNGVMEFRHIYAPSIAAPIAREQWHETAVQREWLVPPEPKLPGFGFSSEHVLGIGGHGTDGTLLATIAPAEYGLLRLPLWILLIPCVVWGVWRSKLAFRAAGGIE